MKIYRDAIVQGDCLKVLATFKWGSVDLVYLDPPFFTQQEWTGAAGSFSDSWKDRDDYLSYMSERLAQLWRLLKPSGSLYLHCDERISHYLKVACDDIFGDKNFRREIVWQQQKVANGFQGKWGANWVLNSSRLLYYVRDVKQVIFNKEYLPVEAVTTQFNRMDQDGRMYWEHSSRRTRARQADPKRIGLGTGSVDGRYYKDEYKGPPVGDVWDDLGVWQRMTQSREARIYPTQKPLRLLRRVIAASSPPGGFVVDPFCGSGTTCVAAAQLGRPYIGVDISRDAVALARERVGEVSTHFAI